MDQFATLKAKAENGWHYLQISFPSHPQNQV